MVTWPQLKINSNPHGGPSGHHKAAVCVALNDSELIALIETRALFTDRWCIQSTFHDDQRWSLSLWMGWWSVVHSSYNAARKRTHSLLVPVGLTEGLELSVRFKGVQIGASRAHGPPFDKAEVLFILMSSLFTHFHLRSGGSKAAIPWHFSHVDRGRNRRRRGRASREGLHGSPGGAQRRGKL
jgi:hypothetical protein